MTPRPDFTAAALDAASRGFRVWPSRLEGKHPLATGYKGQVDFGLTDPSEIRDQTWEHGVCVMLGPRDYVLDADSAAAVPKVAQYDTLRVSTGRGMHAYFRLPEGTRLRQGGRVGASIDGKGFAWGTGTRTVALWAGLDGREIVNDAPVMELPQSWVKHIGPPRLAVDNSDLTAHEHTVLAVAARNLPAGGMSAGARRALDRVAGQLAEELGADGWGHDFYRAAAWFGGEYVASGECEFRVAAEEFVDMFVALDRWKHDPKYVLLSIHNGLVRGTRTRLENPLGE